MGEDQGTGTGPAGFAGAADFAGGAPEAGGAGLADGTAVFGGAEAGVAGFSADEDGVLAFSGALGADDAVFEDGGPLPAAFGSGVGAPESPAGPDLPGSGGDGADDLVSSAIFLCCPNCRETIGEAHF